MAETKRQQWLRRLPNVVRRTYWTTIGHLNRKAYLRHFIDRDPDDWESIEALLCIETGEWTRRGERVNVWITDLPLPEGKTSHWETAADRREYLPWDTLRKFKKIVEDGEYERNRRKREGRELWVKYFTAGAAAIAALAALLNLYFTSRRK
jgi:hypothetical protein